MTRQRSTLANCAPYQAKSWQTTD